MSISRFNGSDGSRTYGWQVRVPTGRGKTPKTKFFADGQTMDEQASYKRALEWEANTRKELGRPTTRTRHVKIIRPNQGVFRVVSKSKGPLWVAQWSPSSGRVRRKVFRVKIHGETRARILATEERLKREVELYGQPLHREPSDLPGG